MKIGRLEWNLVVTLDVLPCSLYSQERLNTALHPSLDFSIHGRMDNTLLLFLFFQRAQFQILDAIVRCQSPPPMKQASYSWKTKVLLGYTCRCLLQMMVSSICWWYTDFTGISLIALYLLSPFTDMYYSNCGMPGIVLVLAALVSSAQ